jgi:hypothetical protein
MIPHWKDHQNAIHVFKMFCFQPLYRSVDYMAILILACANEAA